MNRLAVPAAKHHGRRHGVNFDYRGFDTLGEEFILFAAVLGLALLLRETRDETEGEIEDDAPQRRPPPTSAALRLLTVLLVPFTVLLVDLHHRPRAPDPGRRVPGRGDRRHGAAAGLHRRRVHGAAPGAARSTLVQVAKASGAGAFVLIGIGGILFAAAFLDNFLPVRTPGQLVSAGTIPLLSFSVGFEIAGGFVLLLSEFLDQLLIVRRGRAR